MINIHKNSKLAINEIELEIVERKGIGHPDTLIDGILEEISRNLSKEYIDRFGFILHHNIDKGLITGGETEVDFGKGKVIKKIDITLSGRATSRFKGENIDIDRIAIESTKNYLKKVARNLKEDYYQIESKIRQGSPSLTTLVESKNPTANDTSICVGYAPLSVLERTVLETEKKLNSSEFKVKHPEVGEDIKIMGCRSKNGKKNIIELTIAAAFVSKYLSSISEYMEKKETIKEEAEKIANSIAGNEYDIHVQVNTADKGDNVYLTLTGLSCEMGDDGSAGRGNRANGLISPMRPMTMEAIAGKNPVSHIGKIYPVIATRIAERICDLGAEECDVYLQSRIGHPISKPAAILVDIIWDELEIKRNEKKIKQIIDENLEPDSLQKLQMDFVKGKAFTL